MKLLKHKTVSFLYIIILFNVPISYAQDSDYLLKQGITYYENYDYREAVEKLKQSIEATPESATIADQYYWYAKALFLDSVFNYYKSIDLLNKAIEKDPSYAKAYFLRARLSSFITGETPEVIEDYKNAYAKAKNNYKKDIFIKSISLANIKGSKSGISYVEEYIDYCNSKNESDNRTVSKYQYALAAIYSDAGNDNQAFFMLSLALVNGYKQVDFMFTDFNTLRNTKRFIDLMKKYSVPYALYQLENLNDFKRFRSIGEVGFQRNEVIRHYVENKINSWQKKGKFEKTADYQKRVTPETRIQKVDYYTQAAIDSIGVSMLQWDIVSNDYDADNETFKISFPEFEPVFVQVPIKEAPSFDVNFRNLEFNNMSFTLTENFNLSILHLEITNHDVGKSYIYDSQNDIAFNATRLNLNFDEIEVPLDNHTTATSLGQTNQSTKIIEIGKSDVDSNIPVSTAKNEQTIVLIIGNEDYNRYQTGLSGESNVDFAKKDAEIFSEYANKTLGIPKDNITLLLDATSVQMQREIEKLAELANAYNGEASVLFYYAGHGFPDEQTRESYLMPVDVSGADVRHGIKLNYLYEKLTQFPSKKVIVILDACFSGGGRNQGLLAARGVKVKPKVNVISGNLVVLTSSTGDQSSLPYANKQHGMFTYFLLKKLKDTKGNITIEKLSEHLSREVQINSLKINSKKQNPTILVSPDAGNLWMDWKLN